MELEARQAMERKRRGSITYHASEKVSDILTGVASVNEYG